MSYKLDKEVVKSKARGRWLEILPAIDPRLERACSRVGVHVPCPMGTGSYDGFRMGMESNKDGHAFHNQVENARLSDGFGVLQWLNGWSFYEALKRVDSYLNSGIENQSTTVLEQGKGAGEWRHKAKALNKILSYAKTEPNTYTKLYLHNRGLDEAMSIRSPSLLHHSGVTIRYENQIIKDKSGSWVTVPALIGRLSSSRGWVGASIIRITKEGFKATDYMRQAIEQATGQTPKDVPVKQLLRSCDHMTGGAVRFGHADNVLYVGEGIETMLAVASQLGTLSVAAACTATLLEGMEVPNRVNKLIIFADKDRNGRGEDAANKLRNRMKNRMDVEIRLPPSPIPSDAKGIDWLDDRINLFN